MKTLRANPVATGLAAAAGVATGVAAGAYVTGDLPSSTEATPVAAPAKERKAAAAPAAKKKEAAAAAKEKEAAAAAVLLALTTVECHPKILGHYNKRVCNDMKQAYVKFTECINIDPSKECKDAFAHTFTQYQPKNKYTLKKRQWLQNNNYPQLASRVR